MHEAGDIGVGERARGGEDRGQGGEVGRAAGLRGDEGRRLDGRGVGYGWRGLRGGSLEGRQELGRNRRLGTGRGGDGDGRRQRRQHGEGGGRDFRRVGAEHGQADDGEAGGGCEGQDEREAEECGAAAANGANGGGPVGDRPPAAARARKGW